MIRRLGMAVVAGIGLWGAAPAWAAFHFMQIEQIIGGVNGDTTAQAIQLRMRAAGQSVVSLARLRARDAAGANEVLLDDMTTNVTTSAAGSRILITTPNFANYTDVPLVSDFIMDPIPASYLAAGQVRFTDDASTVYWSLSWGGSGFTGLTTGSVANDADGNFGPPVNMALPSTTLQALFFTGAANALSTTNLANYAVTAGAAVFRNNAGASFTVTAPPPPTGDFDADGDVDGADFIEWQRGNSPAPNSVSDLALWQGDFGTATAAATAIPEPWGMLIAPGVLAAAALSGRTRRRFPRSSE